MTLDEFNLCTKRLLNQFWNAQTNFAYFRAINDQFSPEKAVDILLTNHMRELWHETRQAFFTAMIFELTRMYDRADKTLSVAKWINAGHHLNQSSILRSEVEVDLATITDKDSLVNLLIDRRNKGFFHVDLQQSKEGTDYGEIWPLKISECQELLDRAFALFNKYHQFFCSSPGCHHLGACEPPVPAGDIGTAFRWMKKEFDATKDSREAFEKKRVKRVRAGGR